jgi:hypothetical protein
MGEGGGGGEWGDELMLTVCIGYAGIVRETAVFERTLATMPITDGEGVGTIVAGHVNLSASLAPQAYLLKSIQSYQAHISPIGKIGRT